MKQLLLFLLLITGSYIYGQEIITGAERTTDYLPLIENKRVGIVGNQTSVIGKQHLVDTLKNLGINIVKVFSPEHGFRGNADAGEKIVSGKDVKTGIEIASLYGKSKKPSKAQLDNIDILLFDIQDVGARFYTYISTMHYVMEACAEQNIPLVVLDRPNPNGHVVDGPVLDTNFKSFIGLHPVPILHGMTIGEYAQMINGEAWLANGAQCKLTVIACKNYNRNKNYVLPIAPSPNLPNQSSVYLYPSLCLFEGTVISVGRGTDMPFQQYGHPDLDSTGYQFKPKPSYGSKKPKLNGEICNGFNLRDYGFQQMKTDGKLHLTWLINAYNQLHNKTNFFSRSQFFNLLAGNATLQNQIKQNKSEEEIRASWQPKLEVFKKTRKQYLIY